MEMLSSFPTPYDRNAIAIAAGGDAQILSPNGTTLVTAGGEDDGEAESLEVTKRLTFSRVKQRPNGGGLLGSMLGGERGKKREKENDEEAMAEMGVGSVGGRGTGKKPRVSFGSNSTKLYHPSEVVSTKKRKQVDEDSGEVPVLKLKKPSAPEEPKSQPRGRGTKRSASESGRKGDLMSPPTSNKRSRPPPRPKSIHASLRGPEEEEEMEDAEEAYRPRGYITSPLIEQNPRPRVINPLLANMGEGGLLGSPQVWAKPTQRDALEEDEPDTMVVTLLKDVVKEKDDGTKGGMLGRVGMWGKKQREVEGRVEKIIKGGKKKVEQVAAEHGLSKSGPGSGTKQAVAAAVAAAAAAAPVRASPAPIPVVSSLAPAPAPAPAAPSFSFGGATAPASSSAGGVVVSGPPGGTKIEGFGTSSLQQASSGSSRRSRRSRGRGKR
jgi:hypothetical protein